MITPATERNQPERQVRLTWPQTNRNTQPVFNSVNGYRYISGFAIDIYTDKAHFTPLSNVTGRPLTSTFDLPTTQLIELAEWIVKHKEQLQA